MWIEGQRTLPAEVRLLRTTGRGRETGNSWWEVVLRQGRSRQIREMFFRIGHGVLKLHRVAIGPLRDAELPPGAFRELREEEVEQLRKAGRTTAKLQGRSEAPASRGPRNAAATRQRPERAGGAARRDGANAGGEAAPRPPRKRTTRRPTAPKTRERR